MASNLISIHNLGDTFYVWNAEDVLHLRETHRIVGTLVGCLPRLPNQNSHLGLPLQLMKEQAKLLQDEGIAQIVDDNIPMAEPTAQQIADHVQKRKELYEQQVELCAVDKRNEILRNMDKILEGKKAKRRKKMKAEGREDDDEEKEDPDVDFDVDKIKIVPIPEKSSLIQIKTANDSCSSPRLLEWTFPNTEAETLRFRVFCDLWRQGYVITTGGKFGGDFLVYPGDPVRYHSFYIAVCVPYGNQMNPLDITSMGWLGTNVKKTILLCSVDKEDKVNYLSLQWTGMS